MNGSSVIGQQKSEIPAETEQRKSEYITFTNKTSESEQAMKIIYIIETVLQYKVAEIQERRQEQKEFRKEVKGQIVDKQDKQHDAGKSVSSLSKELSESIKKCISKVENMKQNSPRTQVANDLQEIEISTLQRRMETRLDSVKSSVRTYEALITIVRSCVNKISDVCAEIGRAHV